MKKGNIIMASIFIVFQAYFLYQSFDIPKGINPADPGAGYAPQIFLTAGIILSVIILINSLLSEQKEKFNFDPRFFLYLGVIIIYFILINIVGFYISTILFVLFILLYKDVRSKLILSIVPLALVAFIFVIFDYVIGLPIP